MEIERQRKIRGFPYNIKACDVKLKYLLSVGFNFDFVMDLNLEKI